MDKWKEDWAFSLLYDATGNMSVDIAFQWFVVPEVNTMKNILANLYMNRLSMTILGYADDSSKNSSSPDLDTFIKKAVGLAVFKLKENNSANKPEIRGIPISETLLISSKWRIGEDIFMYDSGLGLYSQEYFYENYNKGSISQVVGQYEGYVCSLASVPCSQWYPVWSKDTQNLIGIKLPVFIDPK